jgi:hypothetical protein
LNPFLLLEKEVKERKGVWKTHKTKKTKRQKYKKPTKTIKNRK